MALTIRNKRIQQLADELSRLTGESRTAAILRALEERKRRLAPDPPGTRRLEHVLDVLENEIWSGIASAYRGRAVTKKERERVLGYWAGGV
jgi:antitoxin VapB